MVMIVLTDPGTIKNGSDSMFSRWESDLRTSFLMPPNSAKQMGTRQRLICPYHVGCNNLDIKNPG